VIRQTNVAIVGSGPYALSLAAHLSARGVEHRIFGPPMRFWHDMPRSIHLKSLAYATNVYVPFPGETFPEWCVANGLESYEPCTMASFAAYGSSMQRRFVSELEEVSVTRVSAHPHGSFELTLESEERLRARCVVFATGLTHLAYTPDVIRGLPGELASHTADHTDYARFSGKHVAVVGGGASAIEAGALVHEAGGRPVVLARGSEAVFHGRTPRDRPWLARLRHPSSALGFGLKSWALEVAPLAVHFLSPGPRAGFVKTHLGPAAPWWIRGRFEGKVPLAVRTTVVRAERVGDRVRLALREEGRGKRIIEVDHVIAGTGFVPDVDRLAYLDPLFRLRLRRIERAPALSMRFESSVAGAYFLGPLTAPSFGPLFRFVAGASHAAPALARHLARSLGPRSSARVPKPVTIGSELAVDAMPRPR
jgi:hypothetical protein